MTTFLTTHYLDEADALCDRILIMDQGRIIAEGRSDDLKAKISGDSLSIRVQAEYSAATAEIAAHMKGAYGVSVSNGLVVLRVSRGDLVLPALLRTLDASGIATESRGIVGATDEEVLEGYVEYLEGELDVDKPPPPPRGVFFFCDLGCAMWVLLDCRHPEGQMWWWEEGNRHKLDLTFPQWLEAWLDGRLSPDFMGTLELQEESWLRPMWE
ncbi:hypothetical protein [Streptomyces flaveolus]|uniref:hypothetical protein n=1 Tax=Streptomyces flaveolus TaxID=67297 RepID=UPI0033F523AD